MISSELLKFLREPRIQECIDKNDWDTIYYQAKIIYTGELTQLLYRAGLDPLAYLNRVPEYFLYETDITSFKIPQHITSIGKSAFEDCSSLTGITIPNSVTSIGWYAFRGCSSFESIAIGNGVTSIGWSAFDNCTSLEGVYIMDIAAWCEMDFGNWDANPLYYAHNLYLNGQLITDLVIPEGVTSIGYCAFLGCSSLTSVTIPDSVTSIGEDAFYGCSGLKNVSYKGTIAQWRRIKEVEAFNFDTTVHCINGDLQLQGNKWVKI